MTDINTMKDFVSAIRETKSGTKPYDTTATVVKTEGSTAWVHIPGGIDETPVQMSIDAKVGDSVNVRVSGGHAWITGNTSRPPTDDATAIVAQETAEVAQETAEEAQATAQATRNYFWHDADGAHVSTVEGDASTGKNVLIDSNGMAIRNGTAELAAFLATLISLGGETCEITFCGDSGKIKAEVNNSGGYKLYMTAKPSDDAATTATYSQLYLSATSSAAGKELDTNRALINMQSSLSNGDVTSSMIEASALTSITIKLQGGPVIGLAQQGILINALNQSCSVTNASNFTVNGNGLVPIVNGDETTDLNNCTETGIYIYTSAASHTPNAAGGSLFVMKTSSTYIKQIAMPNNSGGTASVYARIHYSSGWGSWKTL